MRKLKLLGPAVILMAGFLVCASFSYGTPEYGKKEKKSCTYCHAKVVQDKAEMNKNLKAAGTCYKDNDHSLAKCSPSK